MDSPGPYCYQCQAVAHQACARCGRFYCPSHGGKWTHFDLHSGAGIFGHGRLLCQQCYDSLRSVGLTAIMLLIPLGLVVLFLVFNSWIKFP